MLLQCSETSRLEDCKVDNKEFLESTESCCGESNLVTKGRVNSEGARTNRDNSRSGEKNCGIITGMGVLIRPLNLR